MISTFDDENIDYLYKNIDHPIPNVADGLKKIIIVLLIYMAISLILSIIYVANISSIPDGPVDPDLEKKIMEVREILDAYGEPNVVIPLYLVSTTVIYFNLNNYYYCCSKSKKILILNVAYSIFLALFTWLNKYYSVLERIFFILIPILIIYNSIKLYKVFLFRQDERLKHKLNAVEKYRSKSRKI